jgi:hypothetical protein
LLIPRPTGIGMSWKQRSAIAAVVLAVLATLVIFYRSAREPAPVRDTCEAKGIDPQLRAEGTCEVGSTKQVVVNPGHTVHLKTLDARIVGVRESTTLGGPGGTRIAHGVFETYDLAVTNRTDDPETMGESQTGLFAGEFHGEDVGAERESEPGSFLAKDEPIAPGATERGTVVFQIPEHEAKVMRETGNFDIANFSSSGDYEPEEILDGPEVGVIRTYREPLVR